MPGRLTAAVISIKQLSTTQRARLYELMKTYYEGVSEPQFAQDLAAKDAIIVMSDPQGTIQGFSTLKNLRLKIGGRKVFGVFSGDTVVARAYWGQRVLGKAFLAYLFRQKLRHFFYPYYWYLISKGYKTYLLMANNFPEHYPRYERAIPPAKRALMEAAYRVLYGHYYDRETGIIRLPDDSYRLKDGVAAPTEQLLEDNPRVAFFEKVNPGWKAGDELACIARMTWWMPFFYQCKSLLKLGLPRRAVSPRSPATA